MTLTVILATILTFCMAVVLAPIVLPRLRRLKFGQSILEIGPSWHKSKQGTPTAGGIIFIFPIVIITALLGITSMASGDYRLLFALIFVLLCGTVGFVDDYTKIVRKQNKGLSVRQKTVLLAAVITLYIAAMYFFGYISTDIFIPFVNTHIRLGYFYFLLLIPFTFFFVNSVNLTDGLDGLATSVTLPYSVAFIFVAFVFNAAGKGNIGLAAFAASVTGGLLAFLIFNFHPAKVFMGDTGSLFLGGAVVALAMSYDLPYFILLGGIVYLIEGLSVVLQVGYFKLTHGKRIFKMTPIHHHFEMCKWKEVKIVIVFTAVSALACIAALWGVIYAAAYFI